MVFDFTETKAIEAIKQDNRINFEILRHKNRMIEIQEEMKLAMIGTGGKK